MAAQIDVDKEKIAAFCEKHGIRRLALFGSVLTGDFKPDSDVDVLVEFKPGVSVGFKIFAIEEELSQMLGGRKIDLIYEKYLDPRLKDSVLKSMEIQYAQR